MNHMGNPTTGILACTGALQRLKDGNPLVDLIRTRICHYQK